jgi:aryl-alcohol dehydrogenase-like predicted oxidoreductase
MNRRVLGKTGFGVGEVGVGCWQLGGLCWGDVDESRAFEILGCAVDAGVNFFDTADVYGEGQSEALIGAFLKQCPKEIFVATKIGRFPAPGWPDNFHGDVMAKHVEASLGRLGVEALDLVQLHCIPTEQLERGEVFDALRDLKAQGKIKQIGVSVESMDEALLCIKQEDMASLQVIFNIFRQKPIAVLFDKAKETNTAIIARVPLASGLLGGKLSLETKFPENDHRRFNANGELFNVGETFAGLPFEKGVAVSEKIGKRVPEGMTMAQMSLRWILDHDAVSVVIPGATRPEQVVSNCAVSGLEPLKDQLHGELAELYKTEIHDHIRGPY